MISIEDKQSEIIEEFSMFEDWMDKYQLIIDKGNSLQPIAEAYKTDQNLIEGCQSKVWLHADLSEEGVIEFRADSDALIVKGIVSLLVDLLNGRTPDEILHCDLHFIDAIGLKEHLSPTRSNGLLAMVKQMKLYALAYKNRQQ